MKSSDSLRKSIVKYALEGNLSHHSNDDARSFFDALVAAGNRTKECSHIVRDGDKYFEIIGKDKKEITTKDIAIEDIDSLVIYILGVVRAEFGEMFFTITKLSDEIENGKYMMPEYKFVRKRG